MRLPIRLSLLLLAISSAAAAQYVYIVPVGGSARGFHSSYFAGASVVNPNAKAATLRYDALYPIAGAAPCALPSPQIVPPRAILGLSSACSSLHALVLTSDQPLRIIAEVLTIFSDLPAVPGIQFQPVEAATDWLPPESDALIPIVRMFEGAGKSNLVIVNPNDFVLLVDIHVERPEIRQSAESRIQVQPRSFSMSPVAQIPTPFSITPVIYSGEHNITLRANGKFQAGVSNTYFGSTLYRAAIPLQP